MTPPDQAERTSELPDGPDRGAADTRPALAHADVMMPSRRDGAEGLGGHPELRRTARGGVVFTSGMFVSYLFQFAFAGLAAHSLAQRSAGALLEAVALFTICSITLGADIGLLRFVPIFLRRHPQDVPRLFAVALVPALVGSAGLAILVFAFAPELVHVFFHDAARSETTSELRILAGFLPAAAMSTVMCAGIRPWSNRVAMLVRSFLQPVGRVVLLALSIALGAVTLNLAALAYGVPVAASLVVAGTFLVAMLRRTRADAPEADIASYANIACRFWRFSSPGFLGLVFLSLISSLDVLMVGAYASTKLAAAYSVASRYLLCANFGLMAIVQGVSPQMSRLMDAHEYRAIEIVYKSATWWSIAAGWPPLLALATFAPFFQRLFGHGYVVAAPALTIVALAMLANSGTGPNGTLIQMSGRSGVTLGVWGIGAAINVGLNAWLIPTMALEGAAIAWLGTVVSTAVMFNAMLWHDFRLKPFGRGYVLAAGASLGCYGVLGALVRLTLGTGARSFVTYALVSSALYGYLMFRWRKDLNLDAFESLSGRLLRRSVSTSARPAPTVAKGPATE